MKNSWLIWIFVVIGISCTSANVCDNTAAEECYAELINYESVAFPLYGADESKLEDTCGNINMSLECIDGYVRTCDGHPDCGEDCQDLLKYIHAFRTNSGLPSVAQDLCTEHSPIRDVYLENYKCLEMNAETYSACHRDSVKSQKYLNTIRGFELIINTRCCYFLWYFDCFTNVTRDNCNANATIFVNFALQKLVGHIRDQICVNATESMVCDQGPPMEPPETKDNDVKVEGEEPSKDEDKTVKDKSRDKTGDGSRSTSVRSCAVNVFVLIFCASAMLKRFL